MMLALGSRSMQLMRKERITQGSETRTHSLDIGMSKRVVASVTFAGSTVTGANGTFTNTFAVGDPLLVEGVNLNNGFFTVIGLDAVNAAFLTLDPPPKAEGPITATLRTA